MKDFEPASFNVHGRTVKELKIHGYKFNASPYLKKNLFFRWYMEHFFNKKWRRNTWLLVFLTPLTLFIYLIFTQQYILPKENSLLFVPLNNQIQQLVDYGYERQAKRWSTLLHIYLYSIIPFSIFVMISIWPRCINPIVKAFIYHKEDRRHFLTVEGKRDATLSLFTASIVMLFIVGTFLIMLFSPVNNPSNRSSLYDHLPGVSGFMYILLTSLYLCSVMMLYFFLIIVFIEFPCLIIGHFRYKAYEKKMREGKVEYAMQTFYEEEMQENITPPLRPKDKWDKYDDLWND